MDRTFLPRQHKKRPAEAGLELALAGEERIELSIMVLETTVIPLNYSPKQSEI
jgi:hypothetical protein